MNKHLNENNIIKKNMEKHERGTKTDDFDAKTRLAPTKVTKNCEFDAKTRLAPTKGTKTVDFDANMRDPRTR